MEWELIIVSIKSSIISPAKCFYYCNEGIAKIWNFQLNSHFEIFYVISTFRIQFSSTFTANEVCGDNP